MISIKSHLHLYDVYVIQRTPLRSSAQRCCCPSPISPSYTHTFPPDVFAPPWCTTYTTTQPRQTATGFARCVPGSALPLRSVPFQTLASSRRSALHLCSPCAREPHTSRPNPRVCVYVCVCESVYRARKTIRTKVIGRPPPHGGECKHSPSILR